MPTDRSDQRQGISIFRFQTDLRPLPAVYGGIDANLVVRVFLLRKLPVKRNLESSFLVRRQSPSVNLLLARVEKLAFGIEQVNLETRQGQLVLTLCSSKDLEHVFIVPTARAAFHGHAVLVGMLLQQRQREAIQPGEVLAKMLITDA